MTLDVSLSFYQGYLFPRKISPPLTFLGYVCMEGLLLLLLQEKIWLNGRIELLLCPILQMDRRRVISAMLLEGCLITPPSSSHRK